MDLKLLNQLFSFRDIRNGILGTIVVVGGIGLAIMTLWASQTDPRLAGILAGVSLVFVLLIKLGHARRISARNECARQVAVTRAALPCPSSGRYAPPQ